jgi:hypothetical protein
LLGSPVLHAGQEQSCEEHHPRKTARVQLWRRFARHRHRLECHEESLPRMVAKGAERSTHTQRASKDRLWRP